MSTSVSALQPDWSREKKRFFEWEPSRSLLSSIRTYQRVAGSRRPDRVVRRWLAVLRHRFWSVVTGADIPLNCVIGGGLLIPHPNGIVVHPGAVIGPNCLLFQQVTIGSRGGAAPRLGGHVDVGAGAKVLGDIVVGSNSRIGANAVVLRDVAAGDTVTGIPARSRRSAAERTGVCRAGALDAARLGIESPASDVPEPAPASAPGRPAAAASTTSREH